MSAPRPVDSTMPTLGPTAPPLGARWISTPAWEVAATTHVGSVRERNEDHYLLAHLGRWMRVVDTSLAHGGPGDVFATQGTIIVVADGMGGHGDGDVASSVTLDELATQMMQYMPWYAADGCQADVLRDGFREAAARCQARLTAVATRKGLAPGMGTTLTLAYVQWPHVAVVHIGDSRAYLLRAGALHRLTHDHTLGAQLREAGVADAERSDHVLVNAIGGSSRLPDPEVAVVSLAIGDRLLVCTDGLHGPVVESSVAAAMQAAVSPAAAADALVRLALDAGGPDNVTAAVVFFEGAIQTTSATQAS